MKEVLAVQDHREAVVVCRVGIAANQTAVVLHTDSPVEQWKEVECWREEVEEVVSHLTHRRGEKRQHQGYLPDERHGKV